MSWSLFQIHTAQNGSQQGWKSIGWFANISVTTHVLCEKGIGCLSDVPWWPREATHLCGRRNCLVFVCMLHFFTCVSVKSQEKHKTLWLMLCCPTWDDCPALNCHCVWCTIVSPRELRCLPIPAVPNDGWHMMMFHFESILLKTNVSGDLCGSIWGFDRNNSSQWSFENIFWLAAQAVQCLINLTKPKLLTTHFQMLMHTNQLNSQLNWIISLVTSLDTVVVMPFESLYLLLAPPTPHFSWSGHWWNSHPMLSQLQQPMFSIPVIIDGCTSWLFALSHPLPFICNCNMPWAVVNASPFHLAIIQFQVALLVGHFSHSLGTFQTAVSILCGSLMPQRVWGNSLKESVLMLHVMHAPCIHLCLYLHKSGNVIRVACAIKFLKEHKPFACSLPSKCHFSSQMCSSSVHYHHWVTSIFFLALLLFIVIFKIIIT